MLIASMKRILFFAFLATIIFAGAEVWAIGTASGLGGIAATAKGSLSNIAKLITAGSYVAGMAFAVGAIAKFKQHKENPTQIPISQPIMFLFVGIALIFIPSVFSAGGGTLFGAGGKVAGVSGVASFS